MRVHDAISERVLEIMEARGQRFELLEECWSFGGSSGLKLLQSLLNFTFDEGDLILNALNLGALTAIRRASSRVSSLAGPPTGLFLEVEVPERLAGGVADDKALGVLIDHPWRREAARGGYGTMVARIRFEDSASGPIRNDCSKDVRMV